MTMMAGLSTAIGVIYLVLHGPMVVFPLRMQAAIRAFPRHDWSGRILAAVAMAWSVYLVREMPMGWFDAYKVWLYVAGPVIYILITLFMEELLAARALGGVLLLGASPVLEAASAPNCPGTEWRLVLVAMAYAWVVAGIALVLAPYRFRKAMAVLAGTEGRCRVLGLVGAGFGALLLGLGIRVF